MNWRSSRCLAVSMVSGLHRERTGNVYRTFRPWSSAEGEEGLEEGVAMLGGDALGMELHSMDRSGFVANGHDDVIVRPGVGGQRRMRVGHRQGVIAGCREPRGQAGEQAAAVMADLG